MASSEQNENMRQRVKRAFRPKLNDVGTLPGREEICDKCPDCFSFAGPGMTSFDRAGHYRTNENGTTFWVRPHGVSRDDWDKRGSLSHLAQFDLSVD